MENEILKFIQKRFSQNCNWLDGNCFYFALILEKRFGGRIFYDVINGHFVTKFDGVFYDWTGVVDNKDAIYIEWDKFYEYDFTQFLRIWRDCIK